MFEDRRFRLTRIWSNSLIRIIAPNFQGHVINVSGWDDRDKEGGFYKDYFSQVSSYTVSNYHGERGLSGIDNEIYLDLTISPPRELINRFDVCFNHTTLEHIFDVRKAFSTMCQISRDIVLVIVPFSQVQHETESFKDFWRFTPSCLRALYRENGLDVIYEAESNYKRAAIYLLFVGSKHPERWQGVLPACDPIKEAGHWIGDSLINRTFYFLFKRRRNNLKFWLR